MTVRMPLSRELDDLFRQDRKIALKMIGGAFVGAFFTLILILRVPQEDRTPFLVLCLVTVFAIAGAVAVVGLSLKDIVRRRLDAGKPVNIVLRGYLAHGPLSLFLWFFTVIVGTLALTIAVLSA